MVSDAKGQLVIPMIYDAADDFHEDLAAVLKEGKWGFIDKKGNVIIDFQFVGVMNSFKNGYAAYGKRNFSSGAHYTSDLWGMIDKKGNTAISNRYNYISTAYNGNFIVETEDQKLLINAKEVIIATLKYDQRPVQMLMSTE